MRLIWIIFSITIFLSHWCSFMSAQNLLPDGSFEKSAITCTHPEDGFSNSPFWYPLDATPDLFMGGCSFDETENYFWNKTVAATDGKNFAGLSGRWNSNATYVSEGIATKLVEPLVAGTTYFFTMYVKNEGGYQGLADMTFCVLRPEKHIDLFIATDSILLTNNFGNGTAMSSGNLVASISADAIKSALPGEWTKVTTCFKASGGERYFAIQMPLGTFGDLPACAGNASSGVFRTFYYYLDDLVLNSLPTILSKEVTFCENESISIDLEEHFGAQLPEGVIYQWDDGFIGAKRDLNTAGLMSIVAGLDCGEIPLELHLMSENCVPAFYAPTGFTPNHDDLNDVFQIFLPSDLEVDSFDMAVYNRWGDRVFFSHSTNAGWDGEFQGQAMPADTYIWRVSLQLGSAQGMKRYSDQGVITLIR